MSCKPKYWIVTDLDGTLMDDNYDITPALDTIKWLKSLSIPIIPCTSKTASEVRHFIADIGLSDPFIVENGGAIYIPDIHESAEIEVILGEPYDLLYETLKDISSELTYQLIPLNDLSHADINALTGLNPEEIIRATNRQWSVPFLTPPNEYIDRLTKLAETFKVNIFQGNRMSHLLSINSHKGKAIEKLKAVLGQEQVRVIALGDSQNDLPLLDAGDISIVVPGINGPNRSLINGIQNGQYILAKGAHSIGWSNAIRSILNNEFL